jgi:hypothetical protein
MSITNKIELIDIKKIKEEKILEEENQEVKKNDFIFIFLLLINYKFLK